MPTLLNHVKRLDSIKAKIKSMVDESIGKQIEDSGIIDLSIDAVISGEVGSLQAGCRELFSGNMEDLSEEQMDIAVSAERYALAMVNRGD